MHYFQHTAVRFALLGITLVLVILGAWYFYTRSTLSAVIQGGIEVEETLIIPETTSVDAHQGRVVREGDYEAPINPTRSNQLVSSRAVFTLQESYNQALARATQWSPDAKLISIQSLGVVTKEGKSGEWQLFFGSASKKAGFEIIVYTDAIASTKEIVSTVYGFDLPNEWYDSNDALASLRSQPQFADATLSAISLFYNADGARWGYALATSRGTVSMPVK